MSRTVEGQRNGGSMITRGFHGRRSQGHSKRLPPGPQPTGDFPVLSAGPTPHTPLDAWTFALEAEEGTTIASWSWEEFRALGPSDVTVDIHCVTHWSKFDTDWRGITVERILAAAGLEEPPSPFVMAFCDGGYTTNLPVEDLLEGKALVVWEYDGEPISPEHGGPARLLVPHLYFWKSAKWLRGLRFMEDDEPGFWRSTATTTMVTHGARSATTVTSDTGQAHGRPRRSSPSMKLRREQPNPDRSALIEVCTCPRSVIKSRLPWRWAPCPPSGC
jgi:DMSO/TMAO reductase YedYZ molybdopterin-dependent catalytic subunit